MPQCPGRPENVTACAGERMITVEQREIDYKKALSVKSGHSPAASANQAAPPTPPPDQYTVRVGDNFHFPDIDEYTEGSYPTYAEALAICKQIVDGFLIGGYQAGISAAALYDEYTSFGDDPYIIGAGERFSAWTYAKQRCEELCNTR
jgi:hypothetical protein